MVSKIISRTYNKVVDYSTKPLTSIFLIYLVIITLYSKTLISNLVFILIIFVFFSNFLLFIIVKKAFFELFFLQIKPFFLYFFSRKTFSLSKYEKTSTLSFSKKQVRFFHCSRSISSGAEKLLFKAGEAFLKNKAVQQGTTTQINKVGKFIENASAAVIATGVALLSSCAYVIDKNQRQL